MGYFFNGVNDLGSFQPGFSSENLFLQMLKVIVSVQSSTGKENWKKQLNFILRSRLGWYIGCFDIKGNVNFKPNDGSEIWSTNVKGESSAVSSY